MKEILVAIFGNMSSENTISHRTSYAEFWEPPAVKTSLLAMELTKKRQLSKMSSSLAPPNFQSHLTTKPISYETLKGQVSLKPTFKNNDPEVIHTRCDLKMNSFPRGLSGLLHQLFSLLSKLFPSIFTRLGFLYLGFNSHISPLERPCWTTQANMPTLSSTSSGLALVLLSPLSEIILCISAFPHLPPSAWTSH